jgi:hypothetical protein
MFINGKRQVSLRFHAARGINTKHWARYDVLKCGRVIRGS